MHKQVLYVAVHTHRSSPRPREEEEVGGGGKEGLRKLLFLLLISSLLCDLWTEDNKLTEENKTKQKERGQSVRATRRYPNSYFFVLA